MIKTIKLAVAPNVRKKSLTHSEIYVDTENKRRAEQLFSSLDLNMFNMFINICVYNTLRQNTKCKKRDSIAFCFVKIIAHTIWGCYMYLDKV